MNQLCVYYNVSKNKNEDHPENHKRIITSIDYLIVNLDKSVKMYDDEAIYDYLLDNFNFKDKEEISDILLKIMYSKSYLNEIKKMCSNLKADDLIEGDTYFSNLTYNEIIDNSVILYNICYQIMNNKIKYAYALIRPPSHHAKLNKYNGFCIINHTYLTAKYLHDKYSKKILILDYDVHHGDGTQDFINKNFSDEVYFASMHCFAPGFYPGTGNIDENNEKVLNIPLNRGSDDETYIEKFNDQIIPYIEKIEPDIIIVSNGLDAHNEDPFQVMDLTNEFYKYVTKYLKGLDKPLIYILEGGYNPETIGTISEDIINTLIE
jgi:acetoin utilization deacetylase AcuC-like enzyme